MVVSDDGTDRPAVFLAKEALHGRHQWKAERRPHQLVAVERHEDRPVAPALDLDLVGRPAVLRPVRLPVVVADDRADDPLPFAEVALDGGPKGEAGRAVERVAVQVDRVRRLREFRIVLPAFHDGRRFRQGHLARSTFHCGNCLKRRLSRVLAGRRLACVIVRSWPPRLPCVITQKSPNRERVRYRYWYPYWCAVRESARAQGAG
mmetsp:Transcript_50864/g.99493  ORF Transcript_50864/g.99493 Transcript_50864/m.99493 type:complete len:205 (+) Transcript_50864:209-823(+)